MFLKSNRVEVNLDPVFLCLKPHSCQTFSFGILVVMAIDTAQANILLSPTRKEGQMQAYCMKCRAKREMKDAKRITMKNGRPATQGVCSVCGTKMFRIGKS